MDARPPHRGSLPAAAFAALLLGPSAAAALSLGEGLALVARSAREIAVAETAGAVAASAPVIAGAARLPSVDLYARETLLAYTPETRVRAEPIPLAERASLAYGVQARQLLWDFGRTGGAVRAASGDAEAARLETRAARNRAALGFITAYLRLLRAGALLAVAGEEVTRLAAHRDDTRALLAEGTVTENSLLQAEVRLADAEQRHLQAGNARALAASLVNSLLLRPLAEPLSVEEVPPRGAGDPGPELAGALAEAAAGRPELRELQERVAAAEARRDAARAEHLPRLSVAAAYEFAENRHQVHEGNWSLAAGVDLNLYAGGAARERVSQKGREVLLAVQRLAQARDAVALEVREALLARETALARAAATEKAVEQARENLRLERLRYAEGVGTPTEVLDAVSLAAAAEQNQLNARYDVAEAEARLDFAVGGDLVARWGGGAAAAAGGDRP